MSASFAQREPSARALVDGVASIHFSYVVPSDIESFDRGEPSTIGTARRQSVAPRCQLHAARPPELPCFRMSCFAPLLDMCSPCPARAVLACDCRRRGDRASHRGASCMQRGPLSYRAFECRVLHRYRISAPLVQREPSSRAPVDGAAPERRTAVPAACSEPAELRPRLPARCEAHVPTRA
jgi:hypothetical protein